MNMFDEARTIAGMRTMCALTQSEIARKMGVSQSYVANKVRLLNFSDEIQRKILDAGLTERHARVLLRLKSDKLIKEAIDKIQTMQLSVYETDVLIDNMIVSDMAGKVGGRSAHEGICAFLDVLSESVKNLQSCGVKVRTKTDYYKNKRYVTLVIDE